jgi:glutamine amidotransferase
LIAIVDYGAGNLRSVYRAFRSLGREAVLTGQPGDIMGASGVVLPGVGAFGRALERLREIGMDEALRRCALEGRPLLGICLGMQLFFESSEERFAPAGPLPAGLGLFPGRVRRFPVGMKVPQIGWNQVNPVPGARLFYGVTPGEHMYFVHSYYVQPDDASLVTAWSEYGMGFASAVGRGPIQGVQFHPEKSGGAGLRVLDNFAAMCEGA